MKKKKFFFGIVGLSLCFALNVVHNLSVFAEELVFSSGFGVNTTGNFPNNGSWFVTGYSRFSVPGFDPAWGTLQSVEVVVTSNYSFQIRNWFWEDADCGLFGGPLQTFLTPTFATTDPVEANRVSQFNSYAHSDYRGDFCFAAKGGITATSGSLDTTLPWFYTDAFHLAEFTRSGRLPIITHLNISILPVCCDVLNGRASGTFKVIYNFGASPEFSVKPIIVDQDSEELFSDHLISSPAIGSIGNPENITGGPAVTRADGTREVIQDNTDFYLGDIIETGPGEELDIKFNDDTNFNVPQNARITIDEYVYDDGSPSIEPKFSLLRRLFIWAADFVGDDKTIINDEPCGGHGCNGPGIRGDAADYIDPGLLDVAVRMNVGSPVTLHTAVDTPSSPFTLSFDYAFLMETGQLEVFLGDQSIFTVSGTPTLTNVFKTASVLIDDPSLLGRTGVKLAFTFDGPTGSQLLVDHLSIPGLGNGNFTEFDKGWFKKGPGTLEFVATISEEVLEDLNEAATDEDKDGVANDIDQCSSSNLNPIVVIGGNDSGVKNQVLPTGCSISDLIAQCAANASEHGEFVSCVSKLTNDLKKSGIISGKEKGAIQSTAAKAKVP